MGRTGSERPGRAAPGAAVVGTFAPEEAGDEDRSDDVEGADPTVFGALIGTCARVGTVRSLLDCTPELAAAAVGADGEAALLGASVSDEERGTGRMGVILLPTTGREADGDVSPLGVRLPPVGTAGEEPVRRRAG